MKTVMLVDPDIEDFSHDIVVLPVSHRLVLLAQSWEESGGNAWVALDADEESDEGPLIEAWEDAFEGVRNGNYTKAALPCHIDYVVYGVAP